MPPNRSALTRTVLLSVLALLPTVLLLAGPPDNAAAVAAAIAVVAVAAVAVTTCRVLPPAFAVPAGAATAEQRLRGSFRRASHPDSPGRVRPRAPGPRL